MSVHKCNILLYYTVGSSNNIQADLAHLKTRRDMDNMDSRYTDVVVVNGGDWGRGASIDEARSNMPGNLKGRLPGSALVYRISASTRFEEGRFTRPKEDPVPVRVDPATMNPL